MGKFNTATSYDSICCFRGRDNGTTRRVLWETTSRCNLGCSFCHRTVDNAPDSTAADCAAVLPVFKALGIQDVILSGGEPLLVRDICSILGILKDHGFNVDMCTNGVCVTRSLSSALARALMEISVSIDSCNPLIHDALREQRGAWEATIKAIRTLQDCGLQVHTISLVSMHTIPGIEDTAHFLYGLGIRSMAFIGHLPVRARLNPLISDDIQIRLKRVFECVRAQHPDAAINTKALIKDSEMNVCRAGQYVFGLDVNLILKPCILQSKRDGIALRTLESRGSDILATMLDILRSKPDVVLGEGICPGSTLLNAI